MAMAILMELASTSMRALLGVLVSLLCQCPQGTDGGSYSEFLSALASGDIGKYHMSCYGGWIRRHHVKIPSVAQLLTHSVGMGY
ncbi:Os02g0223501 [Oryza sativa Japonica Group]|uniref:Os02g0223501 protein n=1 Tax=Oryza sativa subsp. japonica TaxID=39947 RepID=A0A0P0VGQ6_ORYSJ|nr:Os02g0223501 [Oryza sativa Japonica Group]